MHANTIVPTGLTIAQAHRIWHMPIQRTGNLVGAVAVSDRESPIPSMFAVFSKWYLTGPLVNVARGPRGTLVVVLVAASATVGPGIGFCNEVLRRLFRLRASELAFFGGNCCGAVSTPLIGHDS